MQKKSENANVLSEKPSFCKIILQDFNLENRDLGLEMSHFFQALSLNVNHFDTNVSSILIMSRKEQ